MDNSNKIIGIILVGIGVLWGLGAFLGYGATWPLIILMIGVFLESIYFKTGKNIEVLVPAGILIVIGLLFIFETMTRWYFAAYTWPIYILAVAFGLFQLYIFGNRESILLVPIGVLCVIALSAFYFMFIHRWVKLGAKLIVPLVLILIGIFIILNGKNNKNIQ